MIHTESCTSLADRIEFSVHGSRAPSRWRGCSPSPLPGPRSPQSYAIGISCWCWSSFFGTMSTTPKKNCWLVVPGCWGLHLKNLLKPHFEWLSHGHPKTPKLPTATGPTSKRMISGAGEVELGSRARPCRGKTLWSNVWCHPNLMISIDNLWWSKCYPNHHVFFCCIDLHENHLSISNLWSSLTFHRLCPWKWGFSQRLGFRKRRHSGRRCSAATSSCRVSGSTLMPLADNRTLPTATWDFNGTHSFNESWEGSCRVRHGPISKNPRSIGRGSEWLMGLTLSKCRRLKCALWTQVAFQQKYSRYWKFHGPASWPSGDIIIIVIIIIIKMSWRLSRSSNQNSSTQNKQNHQF